MLQGLLRRLVPFVFLGVMIVLFVVGLVLFSYLLIVGAIVGILLFAITWIRNQLFPSKQIQRTPPTEKRGRTFEHDDQ